MVCRFWKLATVFDTIFNVEVILIIFQWEILLFQVIGLKYNDQHKTTFVLMQS